MKGHSQQGVKAEGTLLFADGGRERPISLGCGGFFADSRREVLLG